MLPWEWPEDSVFLWEIRREGTSIKNLRPCQDVFRPVKNVFCYHFTPELQRKISTEQAEIPLGKLIDKGILVTAPAAGSPTWIQPPASTGTPSTLPHLILYTKRDVTVWHMHRVLVYQPQISSASPLGTYLRRLSFSSSTELHFLEAQRQCLDTPWLWRKGTAAGPWLQTELLWPRSPWAPR